MAKVHFDGNLIEDSGMYCLAKLLGISRRQAMSHLCALYLWAADYSYDGMCIPYTNREIAEAALYTGDPEKFRDAAEDSGWFVDRQLTLRDFTTIVEMSPCERLPLEQWKPIRQKVLARDGHTCHYCGKALSGWTAHVDHKVPVSDGGTNDYFNLVAACRRCNLSKGTQEYKWFVLGM